MTRLVLISDTHNSDNQLVQIFLKELKEKFPEEDEPFLGGLEDLEVMEVEDGELVYIKEYDGSESVLIKSRDDGWL